MASSPTSIDALVRALGVEDGITGPPVASAGPFWIAQSRVNPSVGSRTHKRFILYDNNNMGMLFMNAEPLTQSLANGNLVVVEGAQIVNIGSQGHAIIFKACQVRDDVRDLTEYKETASRRIVDFRVALTDGYVNNVGDTTATPTTWNAIFGDYLNNLKVENLSKVYNSSLLINVKSNLCALR